MRELFIESPGSIGTAALPEGHPPSLKTRLGICSAGQWALDLDHDRSLWTAPTISAGEQDRVELVGCWLDNNNSAILDCVALGATGLLDYKSDSSSDRTASGKVWASRGSSRIKLRNKLLQVVVP